MVKNCAVVFFIYLSREVLGHQDYFSERIRDCSAIMGGVDSQVSSFRYRDICPKILLLGTIKSAILIQPDHEMQRKQEKQGVPLYMRNWNRHKGTYGEHSVLMCKKL